MANTNTPAELSENAEILLARTNRQGGGMMAYTTDDAKAVAELVDAKLITADFLDMCGEVEYHCRPI